MVAWNSHQTTPRSRARDQLSQYFIGLCLKFEILSREPPYAGLARKNTRAGKIAKPLKRTEGATRQKAFSLGVSLDARV